MTLVEMVRKHGVGAKLKHAVVTARGWRKADSRTGDEGEWYERWPVFSLELATAIREMRS